MTRTDDVTALFESSFGALPAGVWSAPGRVNLIGEHTDYTGGFVMPLAIEQRAYIAARPRADRLVRAVADGHETQAIALDDVGPGRPGGWLAYLAGAAWVAEQARSRPTRRTMAGTSPCCPTCRSARACHRRRPSRARPCWR